MGARFGGAGDVAASAEAKRSAVESDHCAYAACIAEFKAAESAEVDVEPLLCAPPWPVCSCGLGGDSELDLGFSCGFCFENRRKKLCAKASIAAEPSSAIDPDHVPSFLIATNWSAVVGSSATYAISLHRNPVSPFHSSTVSRQMLQSSLLLFPIRYATSPYSLIAKNASAGPQLITLGGPARHPEGVSQDCSVSSSLSGRLVQRIKVESQAM